MPKDLSTAIALASRAVDWTRLERVRGEWRLAAERRLDLPSPEAPLPGGAAVPEWDAFRKEVADALPEKTTLCMGSAQALFRCLVLPTVAPTEVADMAALQLDKVLPLPPEEMSLALETLATDEVNTTVLACAVPTVAIARAAECVGLTPDRIQRVDVAALACVRRLAEVAPASERGREAVLLDEDSSVSLIVQEQGLPVLVRSVPGLDGPPEEILRALRLSLVQVELDRGPLALARITVVSGHPGVEALRSCLEGSLGCGVRRMDPSALGSLSLGAAQRSATGSPFDLMPADWKASLSDRRFRLGLLRYAGGALLLWGLCVAALYGGPVLLDRRAESIQESIRVMEPSSKAVGDVRHRVRMIQAYMDRRLSPLETLREICLLLPEGIELSSFRFRREDKRLSLQGTAQSTPLVYDFKQKVDTSPLFSESALVSGPTANPRTRGADFELLVLFREETP